MSLPTPSAHTHVVVTGASSGIGEALARELAARGHDVALIARRRDRLETLAGELADRHGVEATVHEVDLSSERERAELVRVLRASPKRVAGLCNNAGIASFGRFHETEAERVGQIVALNVAALSGLTADLLPDMVASGEGAVLNVGSVLAYGPVPHNAAYAATKAFALSLSEAVHAELAGTGVSCTAVSPGPVRTEIYGESGDAGIEGLGPAGLWQEPEQVAVAAVDAMEDGRRSIIPGFLNKLFAVSERHLPRTLTLGVSVAVAGLRIPR